MISRQKAEAMIEHVLDYAKGKAQGTEVTVSSSDIATSRFANNSMTQNQSPDRTEVSVRVIKAGRQARLSTDNLSTQSLQKLVDDAISTLKHLEKDEGVLPLAAAEKSKTASLRRFDRETAELGAESRARAVKEIIKIAEKASLQAAGIIESGASFVAIGNSKGLLRTHSQSHAGCSVTMTDGGNTGWAKADELSLSNLDYRALAERAAAKAKANRNQLEVAPGKYRVILEPSAVLDLVSFLSTDFAATSHLDKLSCFLGQLGKRVLGENINITDDCYHPLQAGAPFDGEGLPRQKVCLVENGVLKNLVSGRRSAARMGLLPSGHGLAEPSSEGEACQNLVIAGGDSSLEEMIAQEERAILLTRVWYIRVVDPARKILTGMTRDGSFLVENGRVVNAVKNLRFNQSLLSMLNNVLKLGPAQRSAGEEGIPSVVPAMLVDEFNFSSTTTF